MKKAFLLSLFSSVFNLALISAAEGAFYDTSQYLETTKLSAAYIQNNVSAEANTGGNRADSEDRVRTGDEKVEVRVRNEVNGEELEPINIEVDSNTESFSKERVTEESRSNIEVRVDRNSSRASAASTVKSEDSEEVKESKVNAGNEVDAKAGDNGEVMADIDVDNSAVEADPQPLNRISIAMAAAGNWIKNLFSNIFGFFS